DSARTFYHDYPNNPCIVAQYAAGNKIFRSKYKIIELGHYPQNVKYTQKGKSIQYQIPDGYVIKTEIANKVLHCETKYTCFNKVLFTITWKKGRAEWMVSSERSASGAVNAFLKSKKLE
ncbi:10437_t:CDS:2, partial [Gigaspora margarita]